MSKVVRYGSDAVVVNVHEWFANKYDKDRNHSSYYGNEPSESNCELCDTFDNVTFNGAERFDDIEIKKCGDDTFRITIDIGSGEVKRDGIRFNYCPLCGRKIDE